MQPDFLLLTWLGQPVWLWLGFLATVGLLILGDLGLLQRKQREIGLRESLVVSAVYIAVALLFGAGVWWQLGANAGSEFLSAYLLEKALSLDNVFVIALIFAAVGVPRQHQHRLLTWGIAGALLLRALMIGAGAALIERFAWVSALFALLLLATGVRMLQARHGRAGETEPLPALRWLQRHIRLTDRLHGGALLVRQPDPATGRRQLWATPLLLALLAVETADLLFALDSIPAVFTVTRDPFIAYTSNIFAVLGLRALYFALEALLQRFVYLKQSLALVLIGIGVEGLLALAGMHTSALVSLSLIVVALGGGVVASWWAGRASRVVPLRD